MRSLIAAAVALAGALILNRAAWRVLGRRAIALAGPVVEEVLKTGTAVWLGAPLVGTHFLFGLGEAWSELTRGTGRERPDHRGPDYRGPEQRGPVGGNILAAVTAVAGHTTYGALTRWAVAAGVGWPGALLAAIVLHSLVNILVTPEERSAA